MNITIEIEKAKAIQDLKERLNQYEIISDFLYWRENPKPYIEINNIKQQTVKVKGLTKNETQETKRYIYNNRLINEYEISKMFNDIKVNKPIKWFKHSVNNDEIKAIDTFYNDYEELQKSVVYVDMFNDVKENSINKQEAINMLIDYKYTPVNKLITPDLDIYKKMIDIAIKEVNNSDLDNGKKALDYNNIAEIFIHKIDSETHNKTVLDNLNIEFNFEKIEFVELVKALITSKKVKGTQKEIVEMFASFLKVDISYTQFNNKLTKIQSRNLDIESKFLDSLKTNFHNWLIEQANKR